MKLLNAQDSTARYRPGLAAAVANGSASTDDMLRIQGFIQALTGSKQARANAAAGFAVVSTPEEADLLNTNGMPDAIVKAANSTVESAANKQSAVDYLGAVGHTIATYSANSDNLLPQPAGSAGPGVAPDGSPRHENFFIDALDTIGNIPGFTYRFVSHFTDPAYNYFQEHINPLRFIPAIHDQATQYAAESKLGLDQVRGAEQAMGYKPGDFVSDTAFLWSHGEADFDGGRLEEAQKKFGKDLTNVALGIYYNKAGYGGDFQNAAGTYQQQLDAQYKAGKITDDQMAQAYAAFNDPRLDDAIKFVDRAHRSVGRDLAATFLPGGQDNPAFDKVSGIGDLAWQFVADPTLVVGKAAKTVKFVKYGADSLATEGKVARILGTPDPVTGEIAKPGTLSPLVGYGAIRRNVQSFLDDAAYYRELADSGDHLGAAAQLAYIQARHPGLMPAFHEVNGARVAFTPEQLAEAAKNPGRVATLGGDLNHSRLALTQTDAGLKPARGAELPMIKSDPITTVEDFADWLTNQGGLNRMFAGYAPKQLRIMPGRMGLAGELRAMAGAKISYGKVLRGGTNAAVEGALSHAPVLFDEAGPLLDYFKDADKIIPSEVSDGFINAMRLTGEHQFDATYAGRNADGWLGWSRTARTQADQLTRRWSNLLPTNHLIAFSSAQAGKDVERFLLTALPKYESAMGRYMWEQAPTEAARRTIGKGLINMWAEATGLTRSVYGRNWLDEQNILLDNLGKRSYGLGDTDLIPDAVNGGDKRVALHNSQLQTALMLPAFKDARVVAAKSALLGFDRSINDMTYKGMSDWFKDADGLGIRDPETGKIDLSRNSVLWDQLARMTMSPIAHVRYGLFNGLGIQHLFSVMKLGWLGTTSNMLRQTLEEYIGIKNNAETRAALKLGKAVQYDAGNISRTNKFAVVLPAIHHLIPRVYRPTVADESDAALAIIKGRLNVTLGDVPLTPVQERAAKLAAERIAEPEILEAIGGRATSEAEGGITDAILAHQSGVQTAKHGWRQEKVTGFKQTALDGDAGLKALARMYVERFYDADEPARRALAYLAWHQAAKDPKFLASLDEDTIKQMEELHPIERDQASSTIHKIWGSALHDELDDKKAWVFPHHVEVVPGSKTGKLHVVTHSDGEKTVAPLQYIYRVVSKDDYERIKATGSIDTSGRGSHGQFDENGNDLGAQMFGSATPTRIAIGYGKPEGSVLLKIKYRVGDGWVHDTTFPFEGDQIVATRKAVPISRLEAAAEYRAVFDHSKLDWDMVGTDGKIIPPKTDHLTDYVLNDPRASTFRERAEMLNTDVEGKPLAKDDTKGREQAARRYVEQHLIPDVAAAVHNSAGTAMHPGLVSDLLSPSRLPSATDLHAYDLADLPAHVIQAQYAPAKLVNQPLAALTGALSKVFDQVVTKPMMRLERKPFYIGNYVKAFERLQPYEQKLVENGWEADAAERIIDNMAAGQAMHDTIRMVDNPAIASQLTAVAQNYWLFYRAQEDFFRRWSRIVKESPELIRKAHAAIIGSQNSGMVDRDSDGNLIFTYPGSGAIMDMWNSVARGLGWEKGPMIPTVHDLSSRVDFLNPALMNPLGFSATPMLSVPFDMLSTFIPGSDLLKADVDMTFNGQLGNGRAWWQQFMPTEVNRFLQIKDDNGTTASQVGSAATTAMQNALLAGYAPKSGDDIANQDFINAVRTQTVNTLYARAFLSYFLPSSTSLPELDYAGKDGNLQDLHNSDYLWWSRGVDNLSDEYKAMVSDYGFDKANALWVKLHPDKVIFSVGKTTTDARGASIDPSFGSTQWILGNKDLFEGPYRRVAAYFIPPAPGAFDQTGWNAMTEMGIRQYKDLSQYYMDIATKNATSEWFAKEDAYNNAVSSARNAWEKKDLQDEWAKAKQDMYNRYPILHTYFAQSQGRSDQRSQIVNELTQMVQDPAVAKQHPDLPLPGVAQMLLVYANYQNATKALSGQRSAATAPDKEAVNAAYDSDMQQIITKYPGLADLYNGVFKELSQ